jgi:hypothetical protein
VYWLPARAGGLLEGVAQGQQPRLAEGGPQERQADRQAVAGQAGWHHQVGQAAQVGDIGR